MVGLFVMENNVVLESMIICEFETKTIELCYTIVQQKTYWYLLL